MGSGDAPRAQRALSHAPEDAQFRRRNRVHPGNRLCPHDAASPQATGRIAGERRYADPPEEPLSMYAPVFALNMTSLTVLNVLCRALSYDVYFQITIQTISFSMGVVALASPGIPIVSPSRASASL